MKSIQMKLYIYFVSYLVVFITSFILLNSFFLQKYFFFQEKKSYLQAFKALNQIYTGMDTTNIDELRRLIFLHEKAVMIVDKQNHRPIFNSHKPMNTTTNSKLQTSEKRKKAIPAKSNEKENNIIKYIKESNSLKNKKEIFIIDKYNKKFKEIFFIKKLDNGDFICIFKPIQGKITTIIAMNQFTVALSFILAVFAMIFLLFFTKRITKPIIKLSNISEKIANQDFSEKFTIKNQDEISKLGHAINLISTTLEYSIGELKSDIERKNELDSMRRNFISNISQELKKPIEYIKDSTNNLEQVILGNDSDNFAELDHIINETSKMDTLIKDMLNISYLESGALTLNKTNFYIDRLIENILEEYHELFKEKDIQLNKMLISKEIFADKMQLSQAIINLIENAIKNIDENKILNINIENINSKTKVSIFNSGKQIPNDEIDNIWLSFYNSSMDVNSDPKLELAIIKSIIEKHNGQYGLSNEKNGTCFYFTI